MFNKNFKKKLAGILTAALIAGGLSIPAMPVFAAGSDSKTINVNATIDPTATIAVDTNSIDFGNTNPLTATYGQKMNVTVQSNDTYKVTASASGDLTTSDKKTFSIDHLGVKLDSDTGYQTMSKDPANPVTLATNQPATAGTVYPVDLQLKTDWLNAVPGSGYSTALTFGVSQL